jgi:hypothetical protein
MLSNLFKNGAIASVCILLSSQMNAQETFRSFAKMKVAHQEITYKLPMFDMAQKIKIQMIDGHAIFEGDIVLYNENDPVHDAGISGNNYRWQGGVIPYIIEAGHPRAAEINQAMAIMNQQTKLCIKVRTNEADYVRFINGSGCYSNVGRKGGVQDISISSGCAFGSIMHEMLHAAGMYHEQSRSDRDNYITILSANIDPNYIGNFNKVSNTISSCAYDFGSIMHYPLTAFSTNGQATMQLKVPAPAGVTIGQRAAMSTCDKSGINNLYPSANGCGATCAPFKVYGVIGSRYTQLGGSTGILKCPLTDETGTPDGKGRFNHFQGGSLYWHPTNPAPGAFLIYGDIKAKWAKLGWEVKTGYPITDETGTPDGKGRFNHLRHYNNAGQADGDLSIYWHPSNSGDKAFLIYGNIRAKWAKLGWEVKTGYPITDETPTPDGKGRFNHLRHYNNAGQATGDLSLYWHPSNPGSEAFLIFGDIRAKWAKLGWEVATGYPITDELVCPDGVGRYNHFRKYNAAGQAIGDLSIYWHPTNLGDKAFLIYGAIRDKWASIGWEKSPVGYPITDELPAVDNGRVNYFQKGAIYWNATRGTVVLLGKKQGQPLF